MNTVHDIDEATGADGEDGVTFAMQLARVVAKAIDVALVSVAAVVATGVAAYWVLGQEPPGSDDAASMASLLLGSWLTAVVVGWTYEVVLVARKRKTLGKWVVGVQVTETHAAKAPGLMQSMLRATRQLLLWIVVPLGLLSVWRLLLLERRQAWYDRSSGTRVRWAIATGSKRRRLWRWPAAGLGGWAERHPVVVLSVCVVAVFCYFAWPLRMQEEAAVRAIELLVTANIVGLGVFVATSGLMVRYIRSVGPEGTAGPVLGESILGLGGLSFCGILAGAGYVATQSLPPSEVSSLRLGARLLVFLVLVSGVVALAAMWFTQLEAETEIHDAARTEGSPEPADDQSQVATWSRDSVTLTVSHREQGRVIAIG